ncbi:hypothetical protein FHL15_001853 [Xylaria flabelliformis]|uniref:Siderophore biosynthesis enzyme n=1 Tax=Xylaria flabelliformis TaxID=2512241 RepID=A0A553IA31_9PEZI|nr:hypothetical protein FHL15_001853 [Xylaria flabelliformis]
MFVRTSAVLATAALLAGHAAAKTDIAGCVSSQTVAYGGASLIWYVPDTGEICSFLDCGGGRAPPKTTVPGCAGYEGTATYSPSFLPGFGASATSTSAETVATASSASESSSSALASASASSSKVATITSPPTTILTGTATSSAAVVTHTGSSSGVASSSAAGSGSAGSSTSSAPTTNGAALPTAAVKGAFGIAGLVMGVAML